MLATPRKVQEAMSFRRERRGHEFGGTRKSEALTAEGTAARQDLGQVVSRFYADLVQSSNSSHPSADSATASASVLAGSPAGGTAASNIGRFNGAAGVAAAHPPDEQQEAATALEAALVGDVPLSRNALDRAMVTDAGVMIVQPRPQGQQPQQQQPRGDRFQPQALEERDKGAHREPLDPVQPQAARYGISRRNVGYQLLRKAGWSEGTGLGAQEQGRTEPLAPAAVLGQTGLGFQSGGRRQRRKGDAASDAAAAAQQGQQQPPQQQQQRPKRPLPPDPLEKEDVQTKVKRVQQVLQAEVDDRAGKAIQRYIYSAFNDATGEPTSDSNPLLRRGRSKLSATNPLL